MTRPLTTEEFIEKAKNKHGDKYDYSLVNYINCRTKVKIICNRCKKTFEQRPDTHLEGRGCPFACRQKKNVSSSRYTTEKFIQKAKMIHGDNAYNYDKVVYVVSQIKVEIICNHCGNSFMQIPSSHLRGIGCPICAQKARTNAKRSNTETFIQKAQVVHGIDTYDYSKVKYIHAHSKVIIICNKCKNIFTPTPNNHLNGSGCPIDGREKCANIFRKNTKDFISQAKEVHGDTYDYSQVKYINNKTKVIITCKTCNNSFEQSPSSHLSGQGCPIDGRKNSIKNRTSNTKEFIKKAQVIHGKKSYDYSNVNYVGVLTKVLIICNKCGCRFMQIPNAHLNGQGCPHCIQSKGENFIEAWLLTENLEFQQQYRIEACRSKRALPFDFAVFVDDKILLIEYNGEQHYRPVAFGRSDKTASKQYKGIVQRDAIKRSYCLNNNVPLLTIPYWTTQEDICVQLKRFTSTASMSR